MSEPQITGQVCSLDGCLGPAGITGTGQGYCKKHYTRWRRYGNPLITKYVRGEKPCLVDDCNTLTRKGLYCRKHTERLKRNGTLELKRNGNYEVTKRVPGTKWINNDGYVMLRVDGRKISEHRYVMEQMLGRPLVDKENVHHKNGDRADNRRENLELWNTSQPSGQRIEDKVQWAKEILSLYEPTSLKISKIPNF